MIKSVSPKPAAMPGSVVVLIMMGSVKVLPIASTNCCWVGRTSVPAVAHCVDVATGAGGVLQSIAIGVLIANEGISILENCAKCGIPIPERLIRALEQIKGEEKEN